MRGLYSYTLTNPQFFDSLSLYKIQTIYQTIIEELLPVGWTVRRNDTWLVCWPENGELLAHGFKVHISATITNAEEIIRLIVPICTSENVSFKVVADPFLLSLNCSKRSGRGSAGKFITIYPPNLGSFKHLIETMHLQTRHLAGPYILSDRRYKDSKVVFYRYGGFLRTSQLAIDGTQIPIITAPNGDIEADERLPYFRLPAWVSDPFGGTTEVPQQERHVLAGRYSIEEALTFSNSGGVYRAIDFETGRTVVIKEARPLTAFWRHGQGFIDSVNALQREHAILKKLKHIPSVVDVLGWFSEWEHSFLVEEFVEGIPLSRFRANTTFSLIPFTGDPVRTQRFCEQFRILALGLLDAVQSIHQANILIGDVSPNNVLVHPDSLRVRFIDFESAHDLSEANEVSAFSAKWATPGFRSPDRQKRVALTFADDYYALGMLFYSLLIPVQSFFELNHSARDPFLEEISRVTGLPSQVKVAISALLQGDPEHCRSTLVEWSCTGPCSTGDKLPPQESKLEPAVGKIEEALLGICRYLLNSYDVDRTDRLWPLDFTVFFTNPLSVAFGACGPCLVLKETQGSVPEEVLNWIFSQPISTAAIPPGLYVGLAGIAWTFANVGRLERAAQVWRFMCSSPLLQGRDAGLFQGTAGCGLLSLYLYLRTGEADFLSEATRLGDHLLSTAQRDQRGLFWPSTQANPISFGFAFGGSGIALFFLNLFACSSSRLLKKYCQSTAEMW